MEAEAEACADKKRIATKQSNSIMTPSMTQYMRCVKTKHVTDRRLRDYIRDTLENNFQSISVRSSECVVLSKFISSEF